MQYTFQPFNRGIDSDLNDLPEDLLQFRARPQTFTRTMYNTKSINTYRPLQVSMRKECSVETLTQHLKNAAKQPAKFKNQRGPRYWPKDRCAGQEITDAEAKEIVEQEWRTALALAAVEARINHRHHNLGPRVERTTHGQVVARKK